MWPQSPAKTGMRSVVRTEANAPHPKREDLVVVDDWGPAILSHGVGTTITRGERTGRHWDINGCRPGWRGIQSGVVVAGIFLEGGIRSREQTRTTTATVFFGVIIAHYVDSTQARWDSRGVWRMGGRDRPPG